MTSRWSSRVILLPAGRRPIGRRRGRLEAMDDGRVVPMGLGQQLRHEGGVHGGAASASGGRGEAVLKPSEDVVVGSFVTTDADREVRGQCLPGDEKRAA
jgi:hypothetical protein